MQGFFQGSDRKVVPLELPYTTVNGLVNDRLVNNRLVKNVDRVIASADPRRDFTFDLKRKILCTQRKRELTLEMKM